MSQEHRQFLERVFSKEELRSQTYKPHSTTKSTIKNSK